MAATNNIVSRCVISRKAEEENGGSKFGELSRRVMVLFTNLCIGDMIPCLKWLDVITGFIPRLKATAAELDAFFDQVIEEHHKALKGDDEADKMDFISIILQLQKDGLVEMELAQDNIKAILLVCQKLCF
ncbi:Cytochrome P450 [Corchorus capsularis]|uniref:Cytochrome P450 n=1 Tax=Corchorus capsularis TaxID=210143 RepID=A0A1R3J4T4_COCAP|nr:Cytochrome P450 [Corchorus capsularis]